MRSGWIAATAAVAALVNPMSAAQAATTPNAPMVGEVGCSQSVGATMGYYNIGGRRMWPATAAYGGGTVAAWSLAIARGDSHWSAFQANLSRNPTKTVWFQLCTRAQDSDALNASAATAVLGEIRRRVPGATIYVSAQNSYVAPHVCAVTGSNGPARMQALVDSLVSKGQALRGPSVGALRGPGSSGSGLNEVQPDGCHPNDVGARNMGLRLLGFFG